MEADVMIPYKDHKLCVTRMTEDSFKTSDVIFPVLSEEQSTVIIDDGSGQNFHLKLF